MQKGSWNEYRFQLLAKHEPVAISSIFATGIAYLGYQNIPINFKNLKYQQILLICFVLKYPVETYEWNLK